jgi:hypothetical protein
MSLIRGNESPSSVNGRIYTTCDSNAEDQVTPAQLLPLHPRPDSPCRIVGLEYMMLRSVACCLSVRCSALSHGDPSTLRLQDRGLVVSAHERCPLIVNRTRLWSPSFPCTQLCSIIMPVCASASQVALRDFRDLCDKRYRPSRARLDEAIERQDLEERAVGVF